jgi:hypothetical protein
MHPRDRNMFLHNLSMYIMNNNSVVSRGIWELGKYTLASFSKAAVVLRRDLY